MNKLFKNGLGFSMEMKEWKRWREVEEQDRRRGGRKIPWLECKINRNLIKNEKWAWELNRKFSKGRKISIKEKLKMSTITRN